MTVLSYPPSDLERWREAFSGTTALVTGGAGFIGSHLVDALAAAGARVRVLDDLSNGRRENLTRHLGAHHGGGAGGGSASPVELTVGDIRDAETCRRLAEGARWVFHQAALGSVPRSMKTPALTLDVNVGGTAQVLTAARDAGVERIVYASSSSVYGSSQTLPKREGEEGDPLSPYALSKKMNEELMEVYGRCFGQEIIGLRYFNVYGPRQDPRGPYAAVVPLFFDAYREGRAPRIHGDGEQARDFTFVADAVAANLGAALAPAESCGRAYNVGAGGSTTINRLARRIRELAGGGPEPEHGPPRPGDVRFSLADVSAAREAFGYRPRTSIEEGLGITAASYLKPSRSEPRRGEPIEAGG